MKKKKDVMDVWISFHSVNGYDDEEPDSLEFSTDGQYQFQAPVARLSYQESEVTGLEGTRTSVMVMPDKVVVDRDGAITKVLLAAFGWAPPTAMALPLRVRAFVRVR